MSYDVWRTQYPFAPHYLRIGANNHHYVDEGSGPPVLFVHGNPTWSFYWRHLITAVAGTHRAIAPDHLGCGLSDKPADAPYRLRDHIDALEHLVLTLDLRDITLVVHDWGGAIGMGVAVRHPDRFSKFVIFNTAAFPSPNIPLRIAACRIPGFGALAVRGLNGFAGAAVFMATERGLDPVTRAGYLAPYDSWANRVAVHRFVQDIPMRASHPSWGTIHEVADKLATLRGRPMRIFWGEKDWCFTPAFREEWEKRFPDAVTTKFADAGHYVVEDARDPIIPALVEFLG